MANFAASCELDANRGHTYNFDASQGGGNNYLYVAYPQAYGVPAQTLFNGFIFNDYQTTQNENLINAQGYAQNYIILRTNNQFNGDDITWVIQ